MLIEITIRSCLMCGFGGASAVCLFGRTFLSYKDCCECLEFMLCGRANCCTFKSFHLQWDMLGYATTRHSYARSYPTR